MTRPALWAAAFTAAALVPATARAEWMNGNQLYDTCAARTPVDRAMCLSYVLGVLDGFRSMDQPPKVPEDATAGQVRDVVAKYLGDHPEKRNLQGRTLVRAAIADAWPELQPRELKPQAKPGTKKTAKPTARAKPRTPG